jgi:uncharacterized membrane protein
MISEDILARIAIAVLGLCGFFVARHIRNEKHAERPLVCPIHFDCDTVVHSDYSKFFGVPVEILGMIYYACVTLGYVVLSFMPEALPILLIDSLILISIVAFLFSVYLTIVQSFVIKKFCSWCLVSACICILIFTLTLVSYDFSTLALMFVK